MIGQVFGRLVVIGIGEKKKNKAVKVECLCECGQTTFVSKYSLLNGDTKSCGCLFRELLVARLTVHGKSGTPIYKTWSGIIKRCTDPKTIQWKDYGGRGITVCDRWRVFENFYTDMGDKPFPKAQIDRIDNDKGYFPGNCRWVTGSENSRNRRNNSTLTIGGTTKTTAEWSKITGIGHSTLAFRKMSGWPDEKILSQPLRKRIPVKPSRT